MKTAGFIRGIDCPLRLQEKVRRLTRRGRICWSQDEGSTMVEMAFTMIILSTILFGLIEMCLALYTYHFVSDAAREGSRYAMVHGSTCAVSGASCTVTAAQIQTYVKNLGFPGIKPTAMNVVTSYSAFPVSAVGCVALGCNGPGDLVTVQVNYTFPVSIPFVRTSTIAMSSTSSMVIAQ
ncbi:MAG: TadE/TadG family type IV pilus assembly protein [Acidobacteriota bacterium]